MPRRAGPILLVLAATLGDARGDHRVGFYLLLAAIPFLAVAAMEEFGRYVEGSSPIHATLLALGLGLVVVGAAFRNAGLPVAAVTATYGALAVVLAEACVDAVRDRLERQRPRRVSSQVD